MTDDHRPLPDAILEKLKNSHTKNSKRGRLKIFFGSSAGVGKTYAMLSAAHELAAKGVNVVAGIVETHGRPETDRLLQGLTLLPPLVLDYHGIKVMELDLDAALTAKPDVVLVDELAHTNTPGSRHPKRWNDVTELLDAGIDVMTTLNVQHIESLSDVVAGTTGVWVKETVPDSVFDMAEDIVLVDLDEDDLIKRLEDGKIYIAPGAKARAAQHFFKKSNLSALREIALRRMAERVDAERDATGSNEGQVPLSEKILVCVPLDPTSEKLLRAAKRLGGALKAPWTALYVDRSSASLQPERKRFIEQIERKVERLGGHMVTLHGHDIVDEIITFARRHNITKIIVGKGEKLSVRNLFDSFFVNKLLRKSGYIDVYVITADATDSLPVVSSADKLRTLKPFDYLLALATVAGFTVPGLIAPNLLNGTDQALLYLTGIVMVAERLGLGPSLFYAILAASAFNIFFTPPHHTFSLTDRSYLMTFVVMLVTGYAIATQSSRLRAQAIASREKQQRTEDLYSLTRRLAGTRGRLPVSQVVATYIAERFAADVTVWMTNDEGQPAVVLGNLPEQTYYKDFGALQWCLDNVKNAGIGTSTMPTAAGFYLPLSLGSGVIGVLGVYPREEGRIFTLEEVSALETLASLLASALDRVCAGELVQKAMVEKETEKLRKALISTISGDLLRQPLQSIESMTANLSTGQIAIEPETLRNIAASLSSETRRVAQSLTNAVDVESLELGAVRAETLPCSLRSCVDHAVERLGSILAYHTVEKKFPQDLPEISGDRALIEQLMMNILDNAARYSSLHTTIEIDARKMGAEVVISISDRGAGLPQGMEDKIFEKYFSASHGGPNKGTGLGLTIAAGIVRLHGGRIWAENRSGGGAVISFTLPIA